MVRLENAAGVKFVTVHYRGATPALTDVMGGHTNMMMISVRLGARADRFARAR